MTDILFSPIGLIRTPHNSPQGAPIQPAAAAGIPGEIQIFEDYKEGLADLKGFDRIWLIYFFDRAKPFKLKVIPYLDIVERGLFATRAPSRPNPIGLSCVRLSDVDVKTGILKVLDVDMLDNTPLLDIKPYISNIDSHP